MGYANGFKNKSVVSRLGKLHLNVPQIRGDVEFYPSALEKGIRSKKALTSMPWRAQQKMKHFLLKPRFLQICQHCLSFILSDQDFKKWLTY